MRNYVCAGSRFELEAEEALVYLASRDRLPDQMAWVLKWWRRLREQAIGESKAQEPGEDRDLQDALLVEAPHEASGDRVRRFLGEFQDNPFQGSDGSENLVIHATMLRTAEWCDVAGFEADWRIWAEKKIGQIAHASVSDTERARQATR